MFVMTLTQAQTAVAPGVLLNPFTRIHTRARARSESEM
jgi:hypothetical protein